MPFHHLPKQAETKTLRQKLAEQSARHSSKANGDAKDPAPTGAAAATAAQEECSLMREELNRALKVLAEAEAAKSEAGVQVAEFKQVLCDD